MTLWFRFAPSTALTGASTISKYPDPTAAKSVADGAAQGYTAFLEAAWELSFDTTAGNRLSRLGGRGKNPWDIERQKSAS